MHTTARVSEVLKSLAGEGLPEDVKVAIAYALQGVRARTDVRRLPERLEFDVRIEGLDPQKLQWFPAPATVGRQP
jgi:hypothetical protein